MEIYKSERHMYISKICSEKKKKNHLYLLQFNIEEMTSQVIFHYNTFWLFDQI